MAEIDLPALTVYAAIGFYVLGFLFRNQVVLRLLVLAGSLLYCIYYVYAVAEPLWDAFFGTALIASANLIGLVGLLLSRARIIVPAGERDLLEALRPLEPGLFRRLMRAGEVIHAEAPIEMTQEGEAPDALWFVASGGVRIDKFGSAVNVSGPCFIGEIAWLQGVPATAGTALDPGAVAVRWPRPALARALRRSPRLATALEALIAQDMARKVAAGAPRVAPAAARGALGGEDAD